MAKKIIKSDLSVRGIREMQAQLEKYRDGLIIKCRDFASRLAERGVEIARVQIADFDAIFTGELIQSLHIEYKDSTKYGAVFMVVTDSDHAAFVEFGTGIVGQKSPYPYELPEGVTWEYASGKTIRQLADGRYGWFYSKDGQWYFTEGMPARPFMFLTSLELQKEVVKIAKEVFGK